MRPDRGYAIVFSHVRQFVVLHACKAHPRQSEGIYIVIVRDLVKGGLLEGVSGKGGGYRLCRKPEDYNVFEIIEVMEGTLAPVACLEEDASACPLAAGCHTLPLWKDYYQLTRDFFSSKRLSDLL